MTKLEENERRIEAILFACGEPIEADKLSEIIGIEQPTVCNLIHRIRDRYLDQQVPFDILILENSYQMATRSEYADDIRKALEVSKGATLSAAAMEVLAVIAYNQPVTRAFVEEVRGVDCSSIIRSLAEKNLVEEAGRLSIPGRPIVYQTTSVFLRSFGLESLENLPSLPEDEPQDDPEAQIDGQIDFEEVIVEA